MPSILGTSLLALILTNWTAGCSREILLSCTAFVLRCTLMKSIVISAYLLALLHAASGFHVAPGEISMIVRLLQHA